MTLRVNGEEFKPCKAIALHNVFPLRFVKDLSRQSQPHTHVPMFHHTPKIVLEKGKQGTFTKSILPCVCVTQWLYLLELGRRREFTVYYTIRADHTRSRIDILKNDLSCGVWESQDGHLPSPMHFRDWQTNCALIVFQARGVRDAREAVHDQPDEVHPQEGEAGEGGGHMQLCQKGECDRTRRGFANVSRFWIPMYIL